MDILQYLPYGPHFLFVDKIEYADSNKIIGTFQFPDNSWYYESHFPEHPVTPGVILIECMAQIGLVCFAFYLADIQNKIKFAFTSSDVIFYKPVYPGEKVKVESRLLYFRLGKIKAEITMFDCNEIIVAKGVFTGMKSTKL